MTAVNVTVNLDLVVDLEEWANEYGIDPRDHTEILEDIQWYVHGVVAESYPAEHGVIQNVKHKTKLDTMTTAALDLVGVPRHK